MDVRVPRGDGQRDVLRVQGLSRAQRRHEAGGQAGLPFRHLGAPCRERGSRRGGLQDDGFHWEDDQGGHRVARALRVLLAGEPPQLLREIPDGRAPQQEGGLGLQAHQPEAEVEAVGGRAPRENLAD